MRFLDVTLITGTPPAPVRQNHKRLDRLQRRNRLRRRFPGRCHTLPVRVEHVNSRVIPIAYASRTQRLAAHRVQVVPPRLSHSGLPLRCVSPIRHGACGASLKCVLTADKIDCPRVPFPVRSPSCGTRAEHVTDLKRIHPAAWLDASRRSNASGLAAITRCIRHALICGPIFRLASAGAVSRDRSAEYSILPALPRAAAFRRSAAAPTRARAWPLAGRQAGVRGRAPRCRFPSPA